MNHDWIGLVPAAGRGLRLGLPYPKELYPVIRENRYKPVSQFIVDQILAAGVKHIVFVINETKHQLIGFFGDGKRFGCNISYVVQENTDPNSQSTSPGLANALDSAYHLTKDRIVFFGMPDTIIKPRDIFLQGLPLLDIYDVVLCLFPTQFPQKFGMVEKTPDGKVVRIIDKPQSTKLTNMWGCIVWKPIFTEFLHSQISNFKVYDFAQVMNNAIKADIYIGSVVIDKGDFIDLGTYEEIVELDQQLRYWDI